jgi:hypothetical protein
MPTRKKQKRTSTPIARSEQVLLDESFLLCASGRNCDSIKCEDQIEDRAERALEALLAAYKKRVFLILDDQEKVTIFYLRKYDLMSREVKGVLNRWLNGRGKRIIRFKPAKIKTKVIEDCNLKYGTLDPILCQLAIACHGEAPIWTLDSDFWCAGEFYREIRPVCPAEALASVK